MPRLNPDGAELALADVPRFIRSSTRGYPFDEEPPDGMTMEDVDGDGRVLYMRLPDPHGTYKKHPTEPRLMVAREPGEIGGEYFRVIPEGTIKAWDGVRVTVNRDREGLDLNRNFPSLWRQEFEQVGAGPYPTSEPEVRAMVDFCVAHPNIGAAVSFHTHSGVILRPMGTTSDDDMTPEDLWMIKRLSDIGAEPHRLSGHQRLPRLQVPPEGSHHRHAGLALRAPGRAVLDGRDLGAEQGGRHRQVRLDPLVPRPSARGRPEAAEVERRAVRRPGPRRLEAVRASAAGPGGDRRLGSHELLAQPAAAAARARGRALPGVADAARAVAAQARDPAGHLRAASATTARGDTWRVRLAVGNAGYLPAYVTHRAKERQVVRGTVFEIALPAGATLVTGKEREVGAHLEGHAPRSSLQAFLPDRDVTADRTLQEWIVQGREGRRGGGQRAGGSRGRGERAHHAGLSGDGGRHVLTQS